MLSCVKFPHRRELVPRRYFAYLDFFENFYNLTSSSNGLPIFPLAESLILSRLSWLCCVAVIMLVSPVYFLWFGFTWSSDWKLYHNISRSQQCCLHSMSGRDLILPPWGTCHNQELMLETWHESWVSANTSNTCISCGNL